MPELTELQHFACVFFSGALGFEIGQGAKDLEYRQGLFRGLEDGSIKSRQGLLKRMLEAIGKPDYFCQALDAKLNLSSMDGLPPMLLQMADKKVDAAWRRTFDSPIEWSYTVLGGWMPILLPLLPVMQATARAPKVSVSFEQINILTGALRQYSNFLERVPKENAESVLGKDLADQIQRMVDDNQGLAYGAFAIGSSNKTDWREITVVSQWMTTRFRKAFETLPLHA